MVNRHRASNARRGRNTVDDSPSSLPDTQVSNHDQAELNQTHSGGTPRQPANENQISDSQQQSESRGGSASNTSNTYQQLPPPPLTGSFLSDNSELSIPSAPSQQPLSHQVRPAVLLWCLYQTTAHPGVCCFFSCHNDAELEDHRDIAHPHRKFLLLELPPEIRNMIYGMIGKRVNYHTANAFFPESAPWITLPIGLVFTTPAVNLIQACKQLLREFIMYICEFMPIRVSGYDLSQVRSRAEKRGLARVTRSQGLSHEASIRIATKCEALATVEDSRIFGYNSAVLKFENRMAKWFTDWMLRLDKSQWIGDILFPTRPNPNFPRELELREPGRLPDNFNTVAEFSRFCEQIGPQIHSITIAWFDWRDDVVYNANESRPDASFRALYLVETLTALMPIRGVKSIIWANSVRRCLTNGGQGLFMKQLETAMTSVPIYRGEMKAMMKNLEELLLAFYPCFPDQSKSVFRTKTKLFIWQSSVRKNWHLLKSIVAEKECWASFRVLRDRILYEAIGRCREITTARASLGNAMDFQRLMNLFNAFCCHTHTADGLLKLKKRTHSRAKKPPKDQYDWFSQMHEIVSVTRGGTLAGFRVQSGRLRLGQKLVRQMDVLIARIGPKLELVQADILACDRVSDTETEESVKFVADRLKRVDEARSAVDKRLDALMGTRFDS